MSEFTPLAERELPSPIHLERTLEQLRIEHLDVDDQRLYAIYANAVLEVCVRSGTLDTAETLSIAMVEEPDRPDSDPESIVADSLRLSTTEHSRTPVSGS